MNTITINGVSMQVKGNNISVMNNKVYVDEKLAMEDLSGNVSISFEGDVASLRVDGNATINGDVNGNLNAGGSVSCKNVGGSVDAGGSVSCGDVGGYVDAGGSVSQSILKY